MCPSRIKESAASAHETLRTPATDSGCREWLAASSASRFGPQDAYHHNPDTEFVAIARILNGNYGICAATGQPIGAERLRAIPWTRFAKNAEERLESSGEIKRIQLGELGSVHSKVTWDMEESEAEEEKEESRAEDESLREVDVPATGKQPQPKEPEKKPNARRPMKARVPERGRRRKER